ncbi:MAG: glycosyltransferase [Pedosphaera sp.]|nr:glycosyltransferase [Pedosphaera sp.]
MKKKVYHIADDISYTSGGLRTVVENLSNYLNNFTPFKSSILTLKKEPKDSHLAFEPFRPRFWNYSSAFRMHLEEKIAADSILHLQGVWKYPQYIASKIARQKGNPTVITCHGMLQPYLLNDKGFKKSVYLHLVLKAILDTASCVHAITQSEKDNLATITKNKRIEIIPNLINAPAAQCLTPYNPADEYILYLGRFHWVKGLDLLVDAFGEMKNKALKLYLVGFQNDYSESLLQLVRKRNLVDRVVFLEERIDEGKYKLFSDARVFVAPSYSEVIGMVNLEAAMCHTPVITTFNTGIDPDWGKHGGILIRPNRGELVTALNQAAAWSVEERIDRGKHLSEFALQRYSWERKGYLWNELYCSLR